MLKILSPILFILFWTGAESLQAQQSSNLSLALYSRLQQSDREQFPLLIQMAPGASVQALQQAGVQVIGQYGDFVRANGSRDQIKILENSKDIVRLDCPAGKLQLLNDVMIVQNNADSVHLGVAPLPMAYDGTGVVIGIIDAPVDYQHGDFTDADGNIRIKTLWDQTLPDDGSAPAYGYGITCDSIQLADGTCPHIDYTYWYSHGSGVAGVAASSGNAANAFKGIAPNADIVVVALDFGSDFLTNVVDAIDYVFQYADSVGKPCVINTSFGSYVGSHDATDMVAQTIEAMLDEQPGRVITAAAGNAGNQLIHLGYDVTPESQFTWFKKLSYANLVYWQLWADTADFNNVFFSIGADNPTGWVPKGNSPFFNVLSDFDLTGGGIDSLDYVLVQSGDTIGEALFYAQELNGKYLLECYIEPRYTNYNWRLTTQGSGRFDCWGLEGFTGFSNFVTAGLPSAATFPEIVRYRMPDTDQSIVSSWQCSEKVITVGSYVNRDTMTNYYGEMPPLIDTVGQLFYSSSHGPTRDGRIKPDIASTGSRVLTTGSSVLTSWLISLGAANYMSPDGQHYLQNGTSFASPAVAGIAALYLQRHPDATYAEVKQAILGNARLDSWTGSALPDNRWGYGKADAFRTLTGPYNCDSNFAAYSPDNLSIVALSPTGASLQWQFIPAAEGYQVQWKKAGGSSWKKKSLTNARNIGPLEASTTYQASVRAWCSDGGFTGWSEPVIFTTPALKQLTRDDAISIYPNPATTFCIVSVPDNALCTVRLLDINGRLLWYANDISGVVQVPLENIANGTYVMEVSNAEYFFRKQLIILR